MTAHTDVSPGSLNNTDSSPSPMQSLTLFLYVTVKNAAQQFHIKYHIQNNRAALSIYPQCPITCISQHTVLENKEAVWLFALQGRHSALTMKQGHPFSRV